MQTVKIVKSRKATRVQTTEPGVKRIEVRREKLQFILNSIWQFIENERSQRCLWGYSLRLIETTHKYYSLINRKVNKLRRTFCLFMMVVFF